MTRKAEAAVQARFEGREFEQLENWRRSQPKIPPRSEAVRELVMRALASEKDKAAS